MTQNRSGWRSGLRAFLAEATQSRLRRLTLLAQAALLFERLAGALAPAVIVAGFFVALSWTGIWLGAGTFVRIAGSAIFLGLFAAALWRLRRFSFPSADEARAALDADHADAPAATLADALANQGDPQTESLWRLHLRRAEKSAGRLRPVRPAPRLWAIDPYAVGALAVLALCATGFLAGPEKYARFAAAFDWRWQGAARAPFRIDAWIDPPAYTGKPPIVLTLDQSKEKSAPIAAPAGSSIIVRATGDADLRAAPQGGVQAAKAPSGGGALLEERRFVLRGDGRLRISRGASEIADFALHSVPDLPPTITPLGPPRANLRGSFVLAYRIDDDYGARDAQVSARPSAGLPRPEGHPLFAPPSGPLALAAAPGGLGEAHSTIDWTDSPYAGARVDLSFSVHDEAGNEGRAVLRDFVLPGKNLVNPLARALAEQRGLLALDSAQNGRVLSAIDALMVAPELFTPNLGVYLGLRYAHDALRRARSDADLVAVADFLWQMALHIEEGDTPQAERNLRAAEKALREALSQGAPPEEIARLTQQLQKAMDAFLAEMEKKAARKDQSAESEVPEQQSVTPKDFKSMLDRLAEAAKVGDKQAALDMLDRMQDMLENLRAAERGGGQAARDRKAMRDIDKLMREQQKLRDDTFARERAQPVAPEAEPPQARSQESGPNPDRDKQRPGGGPSLPGQAPSNGESGRSPGATPNQGDLDQRQGQLREKLDSLRRKAQSPGAPAPKGLAEAEQAMREAQKSLGEGDDPAALDAQARALEGLRKGAGELAKQAQQGEGAPGGDEGQTGKGPGMRGESGEARFGRATGRSKVDATSAQRARKVLEELRRRLSDPSRAREELDYLERLIKPE